MQGSKLAIYLIAGALALFGATAAKADVLHIDSFVVNGPIGNPDAEADYIEANWGADDLTFLFKQAADETAGLYGDFFNVSEIGDSPTAVISWNLDGSGLELGYILLKDGVNDNEGHLYSLYTVTPDQVITSGSDQLVGFWDGEAYIEKNISHISFFGVGSEGTPIPEPTTLLLLGSGLLAIGFACRKRTK